MKNIKSFNTISTIDYMIPTLLDNFLKIIIIKNFITLLKL